MRLVPCLLAICSLWSLPAHADEAPRPTPANLHLIDDGSGDNYRNEWGGTWTPANRTVGLGLQLGFPSAITAEFVVGGRNSVVAGLGAFGYRFLNPALSFYFDYLWHPGVLGRADSLALSWYFGLGGWLTLYRDGYGDSGYAYGGDSNLAAAVRIPVGLDLSLGELPLMFYAELVPAVLVFPGIDVGLGASIGARIFF